MADMADDASTEKDASPPPGPGSEGIARPKTQEQELEAGVTSTLLLERVRALHEVSRLALSQLEPYAVADAALGYIAERLNVTVATLWATDDDGEPRLFPVGGFGFPREFYEEFADGIELTDDFAVSRAVAEDTIVAYEDASIREVPEKVQAAYRRHGITLRSLLVLPVRGRSDVFGAITLGWDEPHSLDAAEIDFYSAIASSLGIGLENARLFERVRSSEEKYRTLFNSLIDGFALHEIVVDDSGQPVDYIFLEVNQAFEQLSGLQASEIAGKRVTQVLPGIENDPADWIGAYGRVALTGEPLRFEQYSEPLRRWFSVSAYSPARGRFVTVFDDVSERKAAEDVLRRQASIEEGITRILQAGLAAESEEELGRRCLEVAQGVLGSEFGFIGEIGKDGFLHDIALSDPGWELCTMYDQTGHRRPPGDFPLHGLYGHVITTGSSLCTNDPSSHAASTGTPQGHPPLEKFLASPLRSGERVVGIVALGNRVQPYTELDVRALDSMAPAMVEAFERYRVERAIRDSETRLRALIDSMPVGVALFDSDARPIEMNEVGRSIWGFPGTNTDQIPPGPPPQAWDAETGRPMTFEDWPRYVAAQTGKPVMGRAVQIAGVDGLRRTIQISAAPILSDDGSVANVVVVGEDVTEARERERLNNALTDIGADIGAQLDVDAIASRVVDLVTPGLEADAAVLVWRAEGGWIVREARDAPPNWLGRYYSDKQLTLSKEMTERPRPLILHDIAHSGYFDEPEIAGKIPYDSLLLLPLVARGKLIGVAAFLRRQDRVRFTDAHSDFAAKLMNVVTLALDSASAFERERTIAETLQQAILAPPEPVRGLQTAHLYRPALDVANVGGDFYDVFPIGHDTAVFIVGDISGKGLEAARLTSLVRDGVRAYAYESSDPAWILDHVNTLFFRSSPSGMFATLFLGVIDLLTGNCRYCSAGHPAPVVLHDKGVTQLIERGGSILGGFEEARFATSEMKLEVGDLMVLYTDGLTEARADGELFGETRVCEAIVELAESSLGEIPERLLAATLDFSDNVIKDDVVILAIKRTE
ncbi:MAG TPA: SpoIIE family protein phosphatase [Coriobacteriia bacterium]|nr:SpoIIE family protein phosphatase [Coriobacteriia bacterium]